MSNEYLAGLSGSLPPRVWLRPRELTPAFVAANLAEHARVDYEIACWEWDDLYCGHPL